MRTDFKNISIYFTLLPFLAFFYFGFTYLSVMGINVDEGVIALGVKDFLLQFKNFPYTPLPHSYWNYLIYNDLRFPLNYSTYNGCINLYSSAIFCALNSLNSFWFRFADILFGGLTLLFVFKTIKIWFNRNIAVLTLCLLAVNPVFINACKIAHYAEEIYAVFFLWVGLYCLSVFIRNKKNLFAALTALFFGLGVSSKLIFGAYLLALGFLFVFYYRATRKTFFTKNQLLLSIAFFTLGLLPFLADNLIRNFTPIVNFYKTMIGGGVNNSLDIALVLKTRFRHFLSLLTQNVLPCFSGTFRYRQFYSMDILIFFAAPFIIFSQKNVYRRKMIYVCCFYTIVFLLTVFTPKQPFASHMIILMPFVQLLFAVLFLEIYTNHQNLRKILVLFIALFLCRDLAVNTALLHDIKKNNVHADFSSLIYDVCDYLDKSDIDNFYAVSYLFNSQSVSVLSQKNIGIENYTDYIATRPYLSLTKWTAETLLPLNSFYLIIQKNKPESEELTNDLLLGGYKLSLKKSLQSGNDTAEILLVTKN